MIFLNSQIILVSSASQSAAAAQTGKPLLRFGLALDASGVLQRTIAHTRSADDILCLSDFGVSAPISRDTVQRLLQEAAYCGGIFADFERNSIYLDDFLKELDTACRAASLSLFVPYTKISCAPNAFAVVPGAASGGSLQEELEQGMQKHHGRIAVSFQALRRRFILPSADPNGEELTQEELSTALKKSGAHSFFSQELCANYFTYMEGSSGVFVLYDTDESLQMRLQLIRDIGVPYIFAEWPDCEALFSRS